MKLSIIVPVYNVEQFIVKCIGSLLENKTNDYEIIIVNDGTKDRSIELVKQSFKESKIRFIEQNNQGLSVARNTGVVEACGDYLWFVDSDDWVEPNSVDLICSALENVMVDILYQPYTYEYNLGTIKQISNLYFSDIERGVSVLKHGCPTCAQFYIVRRKFWLEHNFMFYRGILHEDNELIFKVLYIANKVKCLLAPIYYHNIRPGSITQTFNPKRCYSLKIVCSSMFDFLQTKVRTQDVSVYAPYIIDAIYAMLDSAKEGDNDIQREINSYLFYNKKVFATLWHYGDIKARIFYICCMLSFHHYVQVCHIFRMFHK